MLVKVNKFNFNREVLKSEKKVIVCFYSYWSEASMECLEFLDKFGSQNENYKICSVSCDDSPKLIKKYKISAFPALILFKDGYEIKRNFGIQNESTFLYFLEEK